MSSIFDQDLPQTPANHAPLSPLSFIERSAQVYPDRLRSCMVRAFGAAAHLVRTYARCRRPQRLGGLRRTQG